MTRPTKLTHNDLIAYWKNDDHWTAHCANTGRAIGDYASEEDLVANAPIKFAAMPPRSDGDGLYYDGLYANQYEAENDGLEDWKF